MSEETSIFKDLLNHFQAESDKISNILSETAIHDNRSDLGDIRENLLMDVLKRYIPSKFNIEKGGFLFDIEGNKSKQLDILITTEHTLKFLHTVEENSKTFNCIEGCVAVISMKTNLNKSDLNDSILNLDSIPKIKKFAKHPIYTNIDELVKELPLKIIFALRGSDYKTTWKNLHEILEENNITAEQSPDFIVINNEFTIAKRRKAYSAITQKGLNTTPIGNYVGYTKANTDFVGGRALVSIFSEIQRLGNITKEAVFEFGLYMNKIKDADETWEFGYYKDYVKDGKK